MAVYKGTEDGGDWVITEDGARPMTAQEKRLARGERMQVQRDGSCEFCNKWGPAPGEIKLFPSHDPSTRCESGKRSHCTCDTCF
jgi:hypothetical protein